MKKAIFTLAIGDNPMYQAAIHSFRHYAAKVGADLIVADTLTFKVHIESPKFGANPAWAEKLRIGQLLDEYDRVLYLDADILVHPDTPNIFQKYDDLDTVYMLNEGATCVRENEKSLIEQTLGGIDWPYFDNKPIYYNVGVILISKGCRLFDFATLSRLQQVCNEVRFYEQTLFNYELFRNQIKHQALSEDFNRMDMFGKQNYCRAGFIHYAGKGYAKNNRRRDVQFLKDFAQLYQGLVPEQEIARLKQAAWHQFLIKVNKKYPLPSVLINTLCVLFVPR
ncbi:glycosyltransferase family 8 protein [Pseudoalteromonas sp. SMS1]|uniref:glycosyltransferase family 8 protein n=1 Tax=Pseudoalteromonas sp. SMS1 TaxID=2908894 RepID=UPI001F45160B|nr:glycosyltransferase family 8 protein [Pseudoalteromonas sp. SMS1]MCF2858558.1 glycosyltransferase family 8 protein [Pseudoalteromonas sp. SMS1]